MYGKIKSYDKINEMGYIEGYDEIIYFYHQNNVINGTLLNEGDIVSFDYMLEKNPDELPYAINIIKEEYNKGKKSFTELFEIINCLPEEEQNKISQSFMDKIKENMDTTYEYNVSHIQDFENQPMLDETRTLLALVYRDYLVSEEEKKEILEKEKKELIEIENKKKEKYGTDVFANRKKSVTKSNDNSIKPTVIEENKTWFSRFINFVKKVINKENKKI